MSVHSLKRWHWLLLGAVLGLLLGVGREWTLRDLSHYGESLNGFEVLERGLARPASDAPVIRNVRVHRQVLQAGNAREAVHLVCGQYRDTQPDSAGELRWHPFVFVAGIPFHPPGTASESNDLPGSPSATVLNFLSEMRLKYGLRYTNAWWDTYPKLTWLLAAVLTVGVLCPTLIDLWFYGRLIRPAEPKGIDLSGVRQPPGPVSPQPQAATTTGELESLESELAQFLTDPPQESQLASPRAVAVLSVEAAEPAPPTPPQTGPREFAARQDDYYPTARALKPSPDDRVSLPGPHSAQDS